MNGSLATDGCERRVLSAREAARELGVCERTLRRYIAAGRLRHYRLPGGHFRIPVEAIEEFWEQHERAGSDGASRHRGRRAQGSTDAPVASENGSASRRRRPPLDAPVEREYSLTSERLAEIRARFAIE